MECKKCGYMLDAFDTECPRCARMKTEGTLPAPRPQQVVPQGQRMASPQPGNIPSRTATMQRPIPRTAQVQAVPEGIISLTMKQVLGLLGGFLVLLATFLPIMKCLVVGVSIWQISSGTRAFEKIGKEVTDMQKSSAGSGMMPGMGNTSMTSPGFTPGATSGTTPDANSTPAGHDDVTTHLLFIKYVAIIFVILAIVAIGMALSRVYLGYIATGIGTIGLISFILYKALPAISKVNDTFKGEGNLMTMFMPESLKSIPLLSVEWGTVAIFILGGMLMLAGAIVPSTTKE